MNVIFLNRSLLFLEEVYDSPFVLNDDDEDDDDDGFVDADWMTTESGSTASFDSRSHLEVLSVSLARTIRVTTVSVIRCNLFGLVFGPPMLCIALSDLVVCRVVYCG